MSRAARKPWGLGSVTLVRISELNRLYCRRFHSAQVDLQGEFSDGFRTFRLSHGSIMLFVRLSNIARQAAGNQMATDFLSAEDSSIAAIHC